MILHLFVALRRFGSGPLRYFSNFSRTLPCAFQSSSSIWCRVSRNSWLNSACNSCVKLEKQFCCFRFEQSGSLQRLKMLDDSSKGHVQAGQGFVNICLLVTIKSSHGLPFLEGDLWLGLRSCLKHGAARSLCNASQRATQRKRNEALKKRIL